MAACEDDPGEISDPERRGSLPVALAAAIVLRVRAALTRRALDEELARGVNPLARPELALRAAQLQSPGHRRSLAAALRRAVTDACTTVPPVRPPSVPLTRAQIRAASSPLLALADRLDSPRRAAVRGIAIAERLIDDPLASPLYIGGCTHALCELARSAIAEMDRPAVELPHPTHRRPTIAHPATAVVLIGDLSADDVTLARIRIRDRLTARWRARQLDGALADGARPDSTPALSLRARKLISPHLRGRLAHDIEVVIRHARRPWHPFEPAVPMCRRRVIDAEAELQALADRLRAPEPLDAQGIARLRVLLTDGAGPLYTTPGAPNLRRRLQAAVDTLEPRVP